MNTYICNFSKSNGSYKGLIFWIVLIILLINTSVSFASAPVVNYTVDHNYPPYTFADEGGFYGFDPALTNLIFKREDYDVVYSTDAWANVYDAVKNGDIDIAGIIAVTDERKRDVLYSDPVLISYVALYTLADSEKVTNLYPREHAYAISKDRPDLIN